MDQNKSKIETLLSDMVDAIEKPVGLAMWQFDADGPAVLMVAVNDPARLIGVDADELIQVIKDGTDIHNNKIMDDEWDHLLNNLPEDN